MFHQMRMRDRRNPMADRPGMLASNAKLTDADVQQIRDATGSVRSIAQRFGIHFTTVAQIRRRATWKHV